MNQHFFLNFVILEMLIFFFGVYIPRNQQNLISELSNIEDRISKASSINELNKALVSLHTFVLGNSYLFPRSPSNNQSFNNPPPPPPLPPSGAPPNSGNNQNQYGTGCTPSHWYGPATHYGWNQNLGNTDNQKSDNQNKKPNSNSSNPYPSGHWYNIATHYRYNPKDDENDQ